MSQPIVINLPPAPVANSFRDHSGYVNADLYEWALRAWEDVCKRIVDSNITTASQT